MAFSFPRTLPLPHPHFFSIFASTTPSHVNIRASPGKNPNPIHTTHSGNRRQRVLPIAPHLHQPSPCLAKSPISSSSSRSAAGRMPPVRVARVVRGDLESVEGISELETDIPLFLQPPGSSATASPSRPSSRSAATAPSTPLS